MCWPKALYTRLVTVLTEIWRHNWPPRETTMRPITSPPSSGPILVSELIDETSARWKEELVRHTFLPMDAAAILGIPVCTREVPDFWSWSKEKKGIFTIRSAYRMMVHMKFTRGGWLEETMGSSTIDQTAKDWTTLSGTLVRAKLKLFLWRLALHSLRTNDVRARRNMAENPRCSLCGMEDSLKHAVLEYSASRCVWALADTDMVEHMMHTTKIHARNWLFTLQETLSHEEFVQITVILWAIWFARRKAIHEAESQSRVTTNLFVKRFIEDLALSGKPERHNQANQSPTCNAHEPWVPPLVGFLKFNADVAVSSHNDRGLTTVVCRDERGKYLGASAMVYVIRDPPTLETLACREAMSLALDLDEHHLIIASDCQSVIKDIATGGRNKAIVREITTGRADFDACHFRFESRTSNKEAHALARFAISLEFGRYVWFGIPHECVIIPMNIIVNR
ncbi:hypothetical protein D1007_45655 [Hordeum vulgare]|nr:hypothetical protein D1007_45655 [Hordeum vulgare]